jgi:serine/threonine-protein kinase RsbT
MSAPVREVRLPIEHDGDIVAARQSGRALAAEIGCSQTDATLVATAISEVVRNILTHAGRGEVVISIIDGGRRCGLEVVARDAGPGITDIDEAMQDGFTTGRGLGLGLPGARRLMDEFEIASEVAVGTTVTMRKWLPR